MKVTVKCLLYNPSGLIEKIIIAMMLQFCSAKRFAYNEIVRNMGNPDFKPQHIDSIVSSKYKLNIRQAKDAIEEARQTKVSQSELLDEYIKNYESKIEDILKKLDNMDYSDKRRPGLISKLDKRLRKLGKYINHKANNTLPSVIFGTKDLFYKRCKNLISNEEYKSLRNNQFVARGDKTKKGNPNLRIVFEKGVSFLEITTLDKKLAKNGNESKNYVKVKTPIYIPEKKSKKTGKINGFNYKQALINTVLKKDSYKVELLRRNGKIYAHVTFELEPTSLVATAHGYMIGVDTNPDGLALTMIDRNGNYVWSKYLKDSRLLHASGDVRDNICGELAVKVIKLAKQYGAGITAEDLAFKDNVDVKGKFRRVKSQFCYSKLIESIKSACYKYGVELILVKPNYTSKIGLYKYCHMHGLDVHNGAAMVIARRGYGFIEKVPKIYKSMFIPIHMVNKKGELELEEIDLKSEFSAWPHITKRINWLLRKDNTPSFYIQNRKELMKLINA